MWLPEKELLSDQPMPQFDGAPWIDCFEPLIISLITTQFDIELRISP
jgi:hypothetical protein